MKKFFQQTFIGIYCTSGTVLGARSTAVSNSKRKRKRYKNREKGDAGGESGRAGGCEGGGGEGKERKMFNYSSMF